MNFNQSDRDALRAAQQKINPQFVIGNIIEHRPQDPKTYKASPEMNGDLSESTSEMPKIKYNSVHFNSEVTKAPLTSIDEDQEPNLPTNFRDLQTDMWLNMDQVEFDKLEWMSTKADKMIKEKTKEGTLFDKEGRAIPIEKVNNETDIPQGHDIDGLINLLDSAYDPQITYALNVVSKIAALATMGFYDGAFSENIHSILLKNCLLRVRRHIDNRNETICLSALRCMRSLLCNTRVDEVMLDRIHPIISETPRANLWLRADEAAEEFDTELKDIECVEIDAILALIHRTDIITRLFYLLETKSGPLSGTYHECILDILIRIARHSPGLCRLIDKKDNMKQLIRLFLPTAITTQNSKIRPLSVKALKFIRLIIAHSQSGLEQCETENNVIPEEIIPVIESYFFIDCYSYRDIQPNEFEQLFKLHIETLRMMKAMCKLSKFKGSIVSIMSMDRNRLSTNFRVINSLNATKALDSNISMDWQYAAHLIDLTGMFVRLERLYKTNTSRQTLWSGYVSPIILKWLAAIVSERYIPHIDVSIAIATAAQHYRNHVDDENLKNMLDIMINSITTKQFDGTNSSKDFFRILVKESCAKSQFRNFFSENGKLRDPKELPSFGCLSFNTTTEHQLNPLFDKNNPHILLSMFINQLQDAKSRNAKTLSLFVDHLELTRYIKNTASYLDLPLNYESMVQQSQFAQYEIEIISRSLILLGRYYAGDIQDFADSLDIDSSSDTTKYTSSYDFRLKKKECYSNLCHYAVTIMGLLSSESDAPLDVSLDLRDKLFEHILFDRTFQSFVREEDFIREPRQKTLQDEAHRWNYMSGSRKDQSIEYWILRAIYKNLKQFNRFWILKPITDYYKAQLADTDWYKKQKIGKWFEKTLAKGAIVGQDVEVITAILEFNHNMMIYSHSYCHFVIKPNMEDQLASIGTIFLNDDIFLESSIADLLSKNLRLILNRCTLKTHLDEPETPFKDANRILRSLNIPLADFFNKLVEQFESVSYGDAGFSNFILLFITNQSDKMFRKKLFQEKSETCLGQLRVPKDNVWVSMELFLSEKEKDPEIRALIERSKSCIPEGSFLKEYWQFHCS